MMRMPADAYKIVTTARKPSDNVRVLALAKRYPRTPLVVLAMGELGFPTRVLSPVFGGIYTYAAPLAAEGTAAGQVSARLLRHLYRIEKLTKSAKIYGVIADPIRHSISPAVHNRAFQSRRMDAVYLPFLVSPLHAARLLPPGRQGCRSPASASPFRTSRRSSATWTWWIRWPGASARSTRCGARPGNGAAPTPMPPACPARWPPRPAVAKRRC